MGGMAGPAGDGRGGFTEMELSALQEVANILTGSYLNALAQITGPAAGADPAAVGVDFAGALAGRGPGRGGDGVRDRDPHRDALGDGDAPSLGDVLLIPTSEALQPSSRGSAWREHRAPRRRAQRRASARSSRARDPGS